MKWKLDPAHSQIQFAVKHLGISTVRGTFDRFDGVIEEENGQVKSAQVEIDTSSINTRAEARDQHLRSADFFDVENHPKARFELVKVDRNGDGLTAEGNLTIRGTTKPVLLKGEVGGPARDPWGNEKVSATLETRISRKEWGLTWNAALETGGMLVSDEVRLAIDLQAVAA